MVLLLQEPLYDHLPCRIITLPVHRVRGGEYHRTRKCPQGLLSLKVKVKLKIRQHQLSRRSENRFTKTQARKVRFRQRAPPVTPSEGTQDVVVIPRCTQINEAGLDSAPLQRSSCEESSIEAVRPPVPRGW